MFDHAVTASRACALCGDPAVWLLTPVLATFQKRNAAPMMFINRNFPASAKYCQRFSGCGVDTTAQGGLHETPNHKCVSVSASGISACNVAARIDAVRIARRRAGIINRCANVIHDEQAMQMSVCCRHSSNHPADWVNPAQERAPRSAVNRLKDPE